ncbi:hypothetical protein SXCC_00544 [Gluconacetobacter sp. SXCC-1]|nr:hypothetical protein SXCC_00544 [Gluconacetobacter sp. SXCC-1]
MSSNPHNQKHHHEKCGRTQFSVKINTLLAITWIMRTPPALFCVGSK